MVLNQALELAFLIIAPVVFIGGGIWLIIKIDTKYHLNKVQVTLLGGIGVLLVIMLFVLCSIYL